MDDRYVAGLFDGEGYVRITKWRKPGSSHIRYAIFGGIGMSHRPVIEMLHKEYGGCLNENRHDLRKAVNRIQFTWTFASQIGATFLRRIHPFSVVKKDEIEIALLLQDHIDANRYVPAGRNHMDERPNRDEIYAYRDDLFTRITALKKRSFPSLTV